MLPFKFVFSVLLIINIVCAKLIEQDGSWIPRLVKKDLEDYTLVSRIPLTSLYKFTFYKDISILHYTIPKDVERAQLTFKAHETKLSTLGGKCEPQDIDIHLKSDGIPIVSPQNISFPEDFIDNKLRNDITSLKIMSDQSNNSIILDNPVPGDWFAIAFVSWTDPQSDKIEQQGIATVCDTVLYTDLRIKKAPVKIISSNDNLEVFLKNVVNRTTDIYKFFNNEEAYNYKINITVISMCDQCSWVEVIIQARSIPDFDNNLMFCIINTTDSKIQNLTVDFVSYPSEWHYIKIVYGGSQEDDISSQKDYCTKTEEIQDDSVTNNTLNHVYELVRDSKSEYFIFEYNLPPYSNDYAPSLFNITSDNTTSLKFKILPVQDIGGTLSIGVSIKLNFKYYTGYKRKKYETMNSIIFDNDPFVKLVVCISKDKNTSPLMNNLCSFNGKDTPATIVVNNTELSTSSSVVFIPYPEVGTWYVSFRLFCDGHICPCPTVNNNSDQYIITSQKNISHNLWLGSKTCNASVIFSVSSSPCIEGKCDHNGACNYYMSGGFIYSSCRCSGGYAGWDCSNSSNVPSVSEVLISVLFLTLSNLLFLPSIYFAIRRQYYTEAIVYFFTMFFSTFYHACDVTDTNYSFCIVRLSVLQYCDFFCGLLSFWVTLVAMAALNSKKNSFLHMFGAIMIAFGTELNKQALLVFLIPVIVGVCVVITAWGIRCRQTKKIFPARDYLIKYAPIGLLLATVGLVCFAFLQTNANYYIVHSIWHMVIALSILCFLPNRLIFFPKNQL